MTAIKTPYDKANKKFNKTKDELKNASKLAKIFISLPLEKQLEMLNTLQIKDLKEFHLQNGFYIVAHLGNKETIVAFRNNNNYLINKTKLGYETASKSLC